MSTILIIDDDDFIREVAQMCLQTFTEWEVSVAASGPAGLELARRGKVIVSNDVESVLASLEVAPDFSYAKSAADRSAR